MLFYGIPEFHRLREWAALDIPFEYNDFMWPWILDDEAEIRRRIRAYRALCRDRSLDTLHGPFLDMTIHSQDRRIRQASEGRIRQACDIACELGARSVIVHTNFIPNFYDAAYRRGWLESNEAFFGRMLEAYPGLWIYMENMFDEAPDLLATLAQRMDGLRFGIALDIAHAHLSPTDVDEWHRSCAPYVRHYHINDSHGRLDEHLPLGQGNINWRRVLPTLRQDAGVVLEVRSLEHYQQSLRFIHSLWESSSCLHGEQAF